MRVGFRCKMRNEAGPAGWDNGVIDPLQVDWSRGWPLARRSPTKMYTTGPHCREMQHHCSIGHRLGLALHKSSPASRRNGCAKWGDNQDSLLRCYFLR